VSGSITKATLSKVEKPLLQTGGLHGPTYIFSLYDSFNDAQTTYNSLRSAGIPESDLSLVANNVDSRHMVVGPVHERTETGRSEAGTGAEAELY
jgi:hypothetical protein